jgi:hypothetical protein
MKRFRILLLVIPFMLLNYACNNTLEPNAPFRQRYALNGIMRSDTSLQIVTLTKSYEPSDGYNPLTNTEDPAVIGAQINIWYKDTLYPMRDTTIVREDTSRYQDSVHCYYVNNLKPEENQYLDIQAVMPNGILLQSTTQLPEVDSYGFFDSNDDVSIPPTDKDYVYVGWNAQPNIVYAPRIYIIYHHPLGSSTAQKMPVPLFFTNDNGNQTPIYEYPSEDNSVQISMETIKQYLNNIVQGDDKTNYYINGLEIELVSYDVNLSTYYYSIQTSQNDVTVQLDRPDFSNVQGGYGVFGSYVRTTYNLKFTQDYLKSLGFLVNNNL